MTNLLKILIVTGVILITPADMYTIWDGLYQIHPIVSLGTAFYIGMVVLAMAPRKPLWAKLSLLGCIMLSTFLTIGSVNSKNQLNAEARLTSDPYIDKFTSRLHSDSLKIVQNYITINSLDVGYFKALDGEFKATAKARSNRQEQERLYGKISVLDSSMVAWQDSIDSRQKVLSSMGSRLDQGLSSSVKFLTIFWPMAGQIYSFSTICLAGFIISLMSNVMWSFIPFVLPSVTRFRLYKRDCFQLKRRSKKVKKWDNEVKKIVQNWKKKDIPEQGVGNCRKLTDSDDVLTNTDGSIDGNCWDVPRKTGGLRPNGVGWGDFENRQDNFYNNNEKSRRKSRQLAKIVQFCIERYGINPDDIPSSTTLSIELTQINITIAPSTYRSDYKKDIVKILLQLKGENDDKNLPR